MVVRSAEMEAKRGTPFKTTLKHGTDPASRSDGTAFSQTTIALQSWAALRERGTTTGMTIYLTHDGIWKRHTYQGR
jgi:hypothetical protein